MNMDVIKGKWKQVKGEAKTQWGRLTDDDLDQVNGEMEKLVGKVQERYGYERERAEEEVRRFSGRYPDPPAPIVYGGVIGQLVHAIDPHTEADPVAVLIQAMTAFGNVVGRRRYFVADGTRHHPNLFAVIVAATSKGRKGTAWAQARRCFAELDASWRVVSGLGPNLDRRGSVPGGGTSTTQLPGCDPGVTLDLFES